MSSDFFKISKGVTLTPQGSEPTGQDGDIYYNNILNKFRKFENGIWKNLAGEGSGFKNILSEENSKFEAGVQDWTAYDDGAVSIPVDGTGGSPSAISRSATTVVGEVLEDLTSLKISKSAADGQGEGTSVLSKTIDRADRGKPFFTYFSYDASHANYVRGDLKIYAYDVTNSKLLTVYSDTNNGELLQTKGLFSGIFYTEDTTAQIRLIVHCTSTNASAYDVFLDEVVVTPQANIVGPVVGPWIQYSPTLTGFGTISSSQFEYRRVGDSIEIKGYWTNGTVAASLASITLPDSITINSNFVRNNTTASAGSIIGNWASNSTGNNGYLVTAISTDANLLYFGQAYSTSTSQTPTNGNGVSTTGTSMSIHTTLIPINGWTSGASLTANDAGLQTIRASANKSAGAVTANTTIASWTNEVTDNYQGFNPSTGIFVAPKAGDYNVNFSVATTSGTPVPSIRVNGNILATGVGTSNSRGFVNSKLTLAKNDQVTFTIDSSLTLTTSTVDTRINISSIPDFNVFGVQGPIVVGAQTDWVDAGTVGIGATTTAPTKGSVQSEDKVRWRRVGDSAHIRMTFRQTNATGSNAGSGDYLFQMPAGLTIDLDKVASYSTVEGWNSSYNNAFSVGNSHWGNGTNEADGIVVVYDSTNVRIFGIDTTSSAGTVTNLGYPLTGTNQFYTLDFVVPIKGWSSETRLYPTQRVIGTTYLKDVKSSGTAGGTFTSGSYQTRTLNTQEGDTGFCSLSSNQFTLQPGTYEIEVTTPAHRVGDNKVKLANITDSIDVLGINLQSNATTPTSVASFLKTRVVITSAKVFEIQHRCATTEATDGFGRACSFGDNEVYTIVKIDKIY